MPDFASTSRWLNSHWAPDSDLKKKMLDQQFAHSIQQLNKKYAKKLPPQIMQKLQLDHHAKGGMNISPGAGMAPSATRVLPMANGFMRQ